MTDEEEKPRTELDLALVAAKEAPKDSDGQANFFYDTFLNTDFYMPVLLEGAANGSWKALTPADRFQPLFLAFPNGKAIPLFDTLERLQTWADERTLDYLVLAGHITVKIMGGNVALILNPGTPWNYTMMPEILEKVQNAMKQVRPN